MVIAVVDAAAVVDAVVVVVVVVAEAEARFALQPIDE